MLLFFIGILILTTGYLTYSKYVEAQFCPEDKEAASIKKYDGVDYIPLSEFKNMVIHLFNIAGMGPVLAAIQGVLFGPWVFIIIPLGCVFMGAVHDYMCGMVSMRTGGLQLTGMIKKFLGHKFFNFFMIAITLMSFIWVAVFVYGSGDIFLQRFLNQSDFSLSNPLALLVYGIIFLYFLIAAMFPIDKIIARIYPFFAFIFLLGTILLLLGYITKGLNIPSLNLENVHFHKDNLPGISFFFLTVSCGLLSGSHATQAPIISRTVKNEKQGRKIFYLMMCFESVIMMIWALGAMSVYNLNLVDSNLIGSANVVNIIASNYAPYNLGAVVALAVLLLPLTSGDTALRSIRMMVAEALNLSQKPLKNRAIIIIPSVLSSILVLIWAKTGAGSFNIVWRYTMFINQLIALPVLLIASIFLYRQRKNYFIALIPFLFYVFILSTFILNAKIGFNINLTISKIIALVISITVLVVFFIKMVQYRKNKIT